MAEYLGFAIAIAPVAMRMHGDSAFGWLFHLRSARGINQRLALALLPIFLRLLIPVMQLQQLPPAALLLLAVLANSINVYCPVDGYNVY